MASNPSKFSLLRKDVFGVNSSDFENDHYFSGLNVIGIKISFLRLMNL